VVAFDGYLDVAVLKLDETLSGTPVDDNDLGELSAVRLGDSDDIGSTDKLTLFGYPGAAGSVAPTVTEGVASGWVQDDRLDSVRAFLNTDAVSSGGNSGGLAADENLEMIGIPTIGRRNSDGETVFSGVRPINLVLPVIEAARSGQPYTTPYAIAGPASAKVTGISYAGPEALDMVTPDCRPSESDGPLALSADYNGFPGGPHTDVMAVLYDDAGTPLALASSVFPAELKAQGCLTMTFDVAPPPPGDYQLKIGVGGDLRVVYDKFLTFE
jgi:S1-C subfamily serine protease